MTPSSGAGADSGSFGAAERQAMTQRASKFETRYSTLGFNDNAALDDGPMWPASFAVTALTDDVEREMRRLVVTATS